ncbi:recombinase RecT [Herbaspirillum sp.]|nr:recombinase RecT [Herbaspirillum sp.]
MGKPGNVLVAIQWGMEIGLKPMQAMQNIAVINGRPSIWGDAALALVKASPHYEDVIETYEGTGDKKKAVCIAKRKGRTDVVSEFSVEDAKTAGLYKKSGPWTQYPDRMLQMRARSFALRDQFPDVLKGLSIAEEAMDIHKERDMGRADVAQRQTAAIGNDGASPALLEQANAAAEQGVAAYQQFFQNTSKENRKALAGEHDALKRKAQAADAARTVENKPAAQQQEVADVDFVAAMDEAEAKQQAGDGDYVPE